MTNFPSRPSTAMPGSVFIDSIMKLGPSANRDDLIVNEILRGNFPDFLRKMVPITISDKGNTLVYNVMPDYISIGNDTDYTRVPISGPSAQKIADAFGTILPTPKMSDQIWQNAKIQLSPKPLSGMSNINLSGKNYTTQQFLGSKMSDTDAFDYHNKLIQEQLGENYVPGQLVAGHKKDVVLSNDLAPGQLGIHGLHQKGGTPLQQGAGSRHSESYKDYSHGVRLIDNNATLNGKIIKLTDLLKNSQYANLLNGDGVLKEVAYKYDGKSNSSVAVNKSPNDKFDFFTKLNDYLSKINLA